MDLNFIMMKIISTLRSEGLFSLIKKGIRTILNIFRQRFFKPYVIEKILDNYKIKFYIGDIYGEDWYSHDYDISRIPELNWIKQNLEDGDVVVDCGAHHGMYGILCSKWVGGNGKVIGFEALPQNFEIAMKNIQLNQIQNFEIRNEAVGSQNGMFKMSVSSNEVVVEKNTKNKILIPMVTLDNAFQEFSPTLLKIDVEGYELDVLRGAKRILKSIPKLDVEIHFTRFDDRIKVLQEIFELIQKEKYYISLQFDSGEIFPYLPEKHSIEFITSFDRIHLFGLPKISKEN
jgi:FkbM family methyltransferase